MREITIQLPDTGPGTPRIAAWPDNYLCLYRRVDEPRLYTLAAPLTFVSKGGVTFTVKPGFVTDGASVPRLFWWYASPFAGSHAAAVVLHDALYAAHYRRRKDSDALFHDAMLTLPIRTAKVSAMYQSVRAGGSRAWNSKEHIAYWQRFLEVRQR